jgi:hypothetical protein
LLKRFLSSAPNCLCVPICFDITKEFIPVSPFINY